MSIPSVQPALPAMPNSDVEKLRGAPSDDPVVEKERLQKVAREFESLFLYQMLKTMRQTIPKQSIGGDAPLSGSSGKETYTELFDMELSRRLANQGRGSIADLLYRQLEKKFIVDNEVAVVGEKFRAIEPKQVAPLEVSPKVFQPISATAESNPSVALNRNIALDSRAGINVTEDRIISKYGHHIKEAAAQTGLDPALIYAVIKAESSGNRTAVSPAGAKGLMQLTDPVAQQYGVERVFNASQNIAGGSAYLKDLMDRFGDLRLALAAYNAGPGNVRKYGGIPPFAETQGYVRTVIDTLSSASENRETTGAKVR